MVLLSLQQEFSRQLAVLVLLKANLKVRHKEVSIVKLTRCTSFSNLYYFEITLYMFRTVFPSIIRSSRLYTQQQVYVKQVLLPAY